MDEEMVVFKERHFKEFRYKFVRRGVIVCNYSPEEVKENIDILDHLIELDRNYGFSFKFFTELRGTIKYREEDYYRKISDSPPLWEYDVIDIS